MRFIQKIYAIPVTFKKTDEQYTGEVNERARQIFNEFKSANPNSAVDEASDYWTEQAKKEIKAEKSETIQITEEGKQPYNGTNIGNLYEELGAKFGNPQHVKTNSVIVNENNWDCVEISDEKKSEERITFTFCKDDVRLSFYGCKKSDDGGYSFEYSKREKEYIE